jgi:DNA-binding NarL/FixJ family response regulator
MPDSRRAEPFKSRALDFATVDSQPRAANTYNNFPANPVARGGESLISNNTSAALAGTRPTRSPATKALLLIDNVTLTRECLTHLLTTELKGFEIISVVHPQQAAVCGVSPDVVLLKTRSKQRSDGTLRDDIALIASATHLAPVLLLSDDEDGAEAAEAAEYGVAGLFPSSCGVPLLIAAINLVVAGGQFRAPRAGSARPAAAHNESNGAKTVTDRARDSLRDGSERAI